LAVDGWTITVPPSPLFTVPNEAAHPPMTSVPITALLYDGPLLFGFDVAIKGLIFMDVRLKVTSLMDYCNTVLARATKSNSNELERARTPQSVLSVERGSIGLTMIDQRHLLHSDLDWFDVPLRVQFKLTVTDNALVPATEKVPSTRWMLLAGFTGCWPSTPAFCQSSAAVRITSLSQYVRPSRQACSAAGRMVCNAMRMGNVVFTIIKTDVIVGPFVGLFPSLEFCYCSATCRSSI